MARTTGVRQRCGVSCKPRCRVHRWEYTLELPAGADGKRRQVTRGGFATMTEAAEARAAVLSSHRAGTLPSREIRRETVGEYLERWFAEKSTTDRSPGTLRSYRGHLDLYLIPHLGALRLTDLRAHHVSAMLAAIRTAPGRARPMSAATQVRVFATLRAAVRQAVKRGEIPHDHTAHVDLPDGKRPDVEPWEPDTLWALVEHLDGAEPHTMEARVRHVVMFAAGTGLRLGEICGLRWEDVDLDRGVLTVHQQAQTIGRELVYRRPKTKRSKGRVVPLAGWVPEVLRAVRIRQARERLAWGEAWEDTGLVFTMPGGGGLVPSSVSKAFVRYSRTAGLPPCRFHDLRHLAASTLIRQGVPLAIVSRILGHTSITITMDTYGHVRMDDDVRQAMDTALNASRTRLRAVP
jgi:integrase